MNPKPILFAVLAVVVLLALAVTAGFFLPTVWQVEQTVTIQAPASAVHAVVDAPRRWPEWFPVNSAKDPAIRYEFSGPASGMGAVLEWQSEKLGHGTLTIGETEAARVGYRIVFAGFDELPVRGELVLAEANGATTLTYREGGSLSANPIHRLMRGVMEGNLRRDFALALERLKAICEGRPPPVEPPPKD